MIEVNYNEYKETIAENMKLIIENHDLKEKINKAIEYIEKNCILSDTWKELDFCNFVPIAKIKYKALSNKKVKGLLDILKGDDKE